MRLVHLHDDVLRLVPPDSFGPVVSWRGRPISARAVSARLASYLRTFGIDATGHQARHSFGTALYAACHDLVTVQQQMGHCSPQTTRGYVAANDDDARAAIRALYRPGEAAA